jgi:hypothetical protein
VRVYVGQTRGQALIAALERYKFGEMTSRGELPPRRSPWAYDNGAFADWKAGRPFDEAAFVQDVEELVRRPWTPGPDFLVLPDVVMGGPRSLSLSMEWQTKLLGVAPLYLAVQDGMDYAHVLEVIDDVAGIFVGGSLPWKIRSAAGWVKLAHQHRKPCHVGRCGTRKRVQWARRIGVDSIDSCLPLWSTANLVTFLAALQDEAQGELAL